MGVITPILIDGTKATVTLPQLEQGNDHAAIEAPKALATAADADEMFDGPSKEDF